MAEKTAHKIAVIIPVYNSGKYLRECLDSVFSQSFEDFVVVAVNDGSKDDSLQILHEYAGRETGRMTVLDEENSGQGFARNEGIRASESEYIVFVDADDIIEKDYLKTLLDGVEVSGADQAICGYTRFQDDGTVVGTRDALQWKAVLDDGTLHAFCYTACARIFRRDFLERENIRFVPGEGMEDVPFGIHANITAAKTAILDYRGYRYRVNSESTTEKYKKEGVRQTSKLRFPEKGFQEAVSRIRSAHGSQFDDILYYELIRNLCGLLFVVCDKSSRDVVRSITSFSETLMKESFPAGFRSAYTSVGRFKDQPLSYRIAVRVYELFLRAGMLNIFAGMYRAFRGVGALRRV